MGDHRLSRRTLLAAGALLPFRPAPDSYALKSSTPDSSAPKGSAPEGSAQNGSAPSSPAPGGFDPARLRTVPAGTSQLLLVESAGPGATSAALTAYARAGDGGWAAALPAMTARLGARGFSDHRREGDRTTPAGVFAFDATMYGIAADPGVRYPYHRLVPGDWWNENSASPGYNTFGHGPDPGGPSEALWRISPQYTHLAVIRYNMPATPGLGSGIFLHQGAGGPTAGCVSLPGGDLLAVLRWLDPAADPRIAMAPSAWLGRY